ncbi:MAG: hypothetical protein JWN70_1318 [Planctomycetaceae bacterium]|nr:hypothetical protein [Planctomycetaceae bacterium]
MLAETGSWFRLGLANWEDWLANKWPEDCRHEIEREALAAVIPVLRLRFPTAEDVAAVVVKRKIADAELVAAGGMDARHAHQMACENLGVRSRTKGLLCPGCGNHSTHYRQVMIPMTVSGPQSYFQCYHCGQKFGPVDVAK